MPAILTVTPENMESEVINASTPVLLDLWAPWCGPCRTLAPVLEKLAAVSGGALQVAKLNVEEFPDAMAQFSVRGIPALLLFKDGKEIGREVGTKSFSQLTDWLARSNVDLAVPDVPKVGSPMFGAFYGDEELKDFFCNRLTAHALNSQVQISHEPFWIDGQGTTSAALVHTTDPEVFERLTGMQASVINVLELVRPAQAEDVQKLCSVLKAGADLHRTPMQLMKSVLQESSFDWPGLLSQSSEVDGMRVEWLAMSELFLRDKQVSEQQCLDLKTLAKTLERHPDLAVGLLAKLLDSLTPLPKSDSADAWKHSYGLLGSLVFSIAQHRCGWSVEDRNTETRRHEWFTERAEKTATGTFSDEELQAYREQWFRENEVYQLKEDEFYANDHQSLKPIEERIREIVLGLLEGAPTFIKA